MTGLKLHERDPELPALAGDVGLCIPPEPEVLRLVERHLALDEAPAAVSARLEYARWKPSQSITCTYTVGLDGVGEEIVVYKRYAGEKAAHVARHFRSNPHVEQVESTLRPMAVLESEGICLFRFPADRVLRGAARVLNKRRMARHIDRCEHFAPMVVRLRASRIELLRFKPERRAVFRFDAKLRGPDDGRGTGTVGIRVLPPELAAVVSRRRRRLASSDLVPTLLDAEVETGILIESWLDGSALDGGDFGEAFAAGAALAGFHGASPAPDEAASARDRGGLGAMFQLDAGLAELWNRVRLDPAPRATHWIHGDLHPDQFIATTGGPLGLLDLDALRPGRPAEDLASWIADQLAADPELGLDAAGMELLAGYATLREPPGAEEIARACHDELVARAAACLRRLEADALAKSRRLLEAALRIDSTTGKRG